MPDSRLDRLLPLGTAAAFLVLAAVGNALQGSTPALHGDPERVVDFYADKATAISIGMMLSLLSVFFLAWFLAALRRALAGADGRDDPAETAAALAGSAVVALLAAGFALNAAGALRARAEAGIEPDVAVVFYEGGLILTGLAAPVAMAVLLSATARVALRAGALPRWFGWLSAVLAVLGLVTPVSFLLSLAFPVWVLVAGIVLHRRAAGAAPRA